MPKKVGNNNNNILKCIIRKGSWHNEWTWDKSVEYENDHESTWDAYVV